MQVGGFVGITMVVKLIHSIHAMEVEHSWKLEVIVG